MVEKRFIKCCSFSNPMLKPLFLSLLCLILLTLVSSVSATNFTNTTNVGSEIQDFIDDSSGDKEIILEQGDYIDSIMNLNVKRDVTIRGNGKVNIMSNSGGTLFNITSANVKIINLNISGYSAAIISNMSNISIIGNNISTTGNSVIFRGKNPTDILLENNNIISTNLNGVSISTPNFSVVDITLNNNNITGTLNGVYIDMAYSNNTLTITNNNIKGFYDGIYLSASLGNNKIIITNNDITGYYEGVYLDATHSNNTILSFVKNNITGNKHAMYIYSWLWLYGLSLLNNNFTSNDIGLYFDSADVSAFKDIIVKGNTISGTNVGIMFFEGEFILRSSEYSRGSFNSNININYNRILAPIGLNYTSVTADYGSNFDYNWWGANDISGKILGFTTNNHYILKITNLSSLSNVHIGDQLNFALLVLNTTLTNVGVENMPYFVINGTFNSVDYKSTTDKSFLYQLTVKVVGLQVLDASVDEAYDILTFNVNKIPTISTIEHAPNVDAGKIIVIKHTLTDKEGNPVANAVVDFYINGIYVGSSITDVNGVATLNHVFTAGTHSIASKYEGNNTYIESSVSSQIIVSNVETNPVVNKKENNETKTNPNTNNNVTKNNTNKNTNKSTNTNPTASTAMKKTGISVIAALIILLSTLGIYFTRKRNKQ